MVSSCGKNTSKKPNNIRQENIKQVSADSAEMKNVELGVGYLKRGKKGDIDVALGKFKKALTFNPEFALAHSMLANVYDRKGLFDSAEAHYKKSIKYNNGNPDIINNYANFLCQRGSYDLAVEYYNKVIANPSYKTPDFAYENAGVCSMKANKKQQAENYFRQALKLNSKMPNSLYYLMQINLSNEKYLSALAFLQRLEQLVQPSAEMLAAGYKIENGLNDKPLAEKYLTTLKNKFPGSDSLRKIIE